MAGERFVVRVWSKKASTLACEGYRTILRYPVNVTPKGKREKTITYYFCDDLISEQRAIILGRCAEIKSKLKAPVRDIKVTMSLLSINNPPW